MTGDGNTPLVKEANSSKGGSLVTQGAATATNHSQESRFNDATCTSIERR